MHKNACDGALAFWTLETTAWAFVKTDQMLCRSDFGHDGLKQESRCMKLTTAHSTPSPEHTNKKKHDHQPPSPRGNSGRKKHLRELRTAPIPVRCFTAPNDFRSTVMGPRHGDRWPSSCLAGRAASEEDPRDQRHEAGASEMRTLSFGCGTWSVHCSVSRRVELARSVGLVWLFVACLCNVLQ